MLFLNLKMMKFVSTVYYIPGICAIEKKIKEEGKKRKAKKKEKLNKNQ